jgi:hypothetical protein
MEGQNLLTPDRVENPVGKLDFNPEQTAIESVLAANRGGIDQAEAVSLLFITRADIRCNTGPREAVNRFAKSGIVLPGGAAIGEEQQVVAGDADTGGQPARCASAFP